jgi:hypothetical protein
MSTMFLAPVVFDLPNNMISLISWSGVLPTGATKALLGAAGVAEGGAKLLTGSGIMPNVPEPSAPDDIPTGAAAGAAVGIAPAGAAPNSSGYSLRPVSSNLSCSRSFCSISTPFS